MSDVNDSKQMVACRNAIAKHQENIRRWRRMIADAESAIDFQKKQMFKLEGKEYYVYIVFVDTLPVYVGKGKGDRYKHPVSGCSSCPELNRDFFSGKYIEVMFVEEFMTEERALKVENEWISQIHIDSDYGDRYPIYNKKMPDKEEYMDECMNYFYHRWFTHAIDNSHIEGVTKVQLPDIGSVWDRAERCTE